MGSEIERRPAADENAAIIKLMERMKPQIQAALPRHVTPERMTRMVLTMIRKTPRLLQCDQRGLLAGIIELSQLGLEPATPLGHAWIIPYGSEPQVIIGYKGLISLAARAGLMLMADCVYEKDDFSWTQGTHPRINHVPSLDEDRGAITRAYAIAHWPDGRYLFKVIGPSELERARSSSSAWRRGQTDLSKRDSPWYTDYSAMCAKTAIKRLAPFLPLSSEFARAVELDDQADRGERQVFVPEKLNVDDFKPTPEDTAERLRGALDEAAEATAEQPQAEAPAKPAGDWPLKPRERTAPKK